VELRPGTVAVYTTQALEGMRRALDRFDDETVNRRPHGEATNSAAAIVTHACAAATFWFDHVGLGRDTERDRDAEFTTEATVADLHILVDRTEEQLTTLAAELDTGPSAGDHELRVLLPGGDTSDASVVLHALEELFQHLGQLELTADALGRPDGAAGFPDAG
jgi:uncharacterized damage-inducible protein DinB